MEVDLALLCDAANTTRDDKLNVLGTFDRITAPTFPTVHPLMHFVLRLSASAAEAGETRDLAIRFLNEDGNRIGDVEAQLVIPHLQHPGRRIGIQLILPLPNTMYPEPGEYALHVLLGRDEKAVVPLTVVQSPPSEAENSNDN